MKMSFEEIEALPPEEKKKISYEEMWERFPQKMWANRKYYTKEEWRAMLKEKEIDGGNHSVEVVKKDK